jgi:5-formyltetrahydrofolate cyclo-ligase
MSAVPSHRLKADKRALRRRVLAERDALPPGDRAERSAAIVARLLDLPEVTHARTVMAFWSFGSEVETRGLIARLDRDGKLVALPRTYERELVAVRYAPGDPVTPTSFGAMEPASGRPLDPAEIDLVVAPGVAFDRTGRRLGYGAGFYDRFLGRRRPDATTVAPAFAVQVVDDVPSGRGDRRVDAIVTEDEVIRCRSRSERPGPP